MALEPSFNFIDDLDSSNPAAGDDPSEGDDHIRGVKNALQGSFTSLGSAAVTKTAAEINDLVENSADVVITGVKNHLTSKLIAADAILNTSVSGTAFLDEDDMASDSATKFCSQQSIKAYVDDKTAALNTKIIEIGDWNMETTSNVTIAHGLTQSKIRTISVAIRHDTEATAIQDFASAFSTVQTGSHILAATSANISITRSTGGIFDSSSYNATTYNRGWITVQYID